MWGRADGEDATGESATRDMTRQILLFYRVGRPFRNYPEAHPTKHDNHMALRLRAGPIRQGQSSSPGPDFQGSPCEIPRYLSVETLPSH